MMPPKPQKHTIRGRKATFTNHTKYSIDFMAWSAKGATPDELARYGFYYDPIKAHMDRIMCFCCKRKEINWAADTFKSDTIPIEQSLICKHHKNSPSCEYASILSAKLKSTQISNYDWSQDDIFKEVEKSSYIRLRTFRLGKSPFLKSRSELPSPEQFAANGFFYMPSGDSDSDDHVECMYCNTCLEGWEDGDNVEKEHRSTNPNCYVFHYNSEANPKFTFKNKSGIDKPISVKEAVFTDIDMLSTSSLKPEFEEPLLKSHVEPPVASEKPILSLISSTTEKVIPSRDGIALISSPSKKDFLISNRSQTPVLTSSPIKPQTEIINDDNSIEVLSKGSSPSKLENFQESQANTGENSRRLSKNFDQVRLQEEVVELDDFEDIKESTQIEEVDIPLSTLDELDSLFFVEGSSHRPSTFFNRSRTYSALPSSVGNNKQDVKKPEVTKTVDRQTESKTIKSSTTNIATGGETPLKNTPENNEILNSEPPDPDQEKYEPSQAFNEPDVYFGEESKDTEDYEEPPQDFEQPEISHENSFQSNRNDEKEVTNEGIVEDKCLDIVDSDIREEGSIKVPVICNDSSGENVLARKPEFEQTNENKDIIEENKSEEILNKDYQSEVEITDKILGNSQLIGLAEYEKVENVNELSKEKEYSVERKRHNKNKSKRSSKTHHKKRKNFGDITNNLEESGSIKEKKSKKREKKHKKSNKNKKEQKLKKSVEDDTKNDVNNEVLDLPTKKEHDSNEVLDLPTKKEHDSNELLEPSNDIIADNPDTFSLAKEESGIGNNVSLDNVGNNTSEPKLSDKIEATICNINNKDNSIEDLLDGFEKGQVATKFSHNKNSDVESKIEIVKSPIVPSKRSSTESEEVVAPDSSNAEGRKVHRKALRGKFRHTRSRMTTDGKTIPSDDLLSISSRSSSIIPKRGIKKHKANPKRRKNRVEASNSSDLLHSMDSSVNIETVKQDIEKEVISNHDSFVSGDKDGKTTDKLVHLIESTSKEDIDMNGVGDDAPKVNSPNLHTDISEASNEDMIKHSIAAVEVKVNTSGHEPNINVSVNSGNECLKFGKLERRVSLEGKINVIDSGHEQIVGLVDAPHNNVLKVDHSDEESSSQSQQKEYSSFEESLQKNSIAPIRDDHILKKQYEDSDDEVLLENHEVEPMQSSFMKPTKYNKKPSGIFIRDNMALLPPTDSDYELEPQTSPLATKGNKQLPSSPAGIDAVVADSYERTLPDEDNRSNQRLVSSEAFLLQNKPSDEISFKGIQKTPTSASLSLAFSSLSKAQSTPQALIQVPVGDIKSNDDIEVDLEVDANDSKPENLFDNNKDVVDDTNNTEAEGWTPIDNSKFTGYLDEITSATNYVKNILDSKYESLHDDMDGRLTNFISEMPAEELGMTIKDWVYYQAEQGSNLIEAKGKAMLEDFKVEAQRALKVLEALPTMD